MSPERARALLAGAPVATLATVRPDGSPHVVPVTFAVVGDVVYTAVDGKPKRSRRLQRLANIAAEPRVSLLAQHWEADWSRLWWVRADGTAHEVAAEPTVEALAVEAVAVEALAAKYEQYAATPPAGPFVVVALRRVTGWSPAD